MTESTDAAAEDVNGVVVEDHLKPIHSHREETLSGVLYRIGAEIFYPDPSSAAPLPQRIRTSLSDHTPLLPQAAQNTSADLLRWARTGSPLRPLLLICVGTIGLLALIGFLLFTLFFVAATVNAIIICFLISLALLGGFLAFFFTCVTTIYIWSLTIALSVISTVTISAIVAVLVTTGWVVFFWTAWVVTKKITATVKESLGATTSAVSDFAVVSTSAVSDFATLSGKHQNGKDDLRE